MVLGAVWALPLAAQVEISGVATDLAGRPFPGITVKAHNAESGLSITETVPHSDGTFSLSVPPAVYVVATTDPPPPFDPIHVRVDARSGSVSGLILRIGTRSPFIPDTPPRASRIALSTPNADGDVSVTGAAGTVPPGTFLVLVTLDSGHVVTTQARDDGGFQTSTFAPPGSSIMIKADSHGIAFSALRRSLERGDLPTNLPELPGTIVRVPDPPPDGAGIPFGTAGGAIAAQSGNSGSPPWTFQGMLLTPAVAPGGTVRIRGVFRLLSPVVQQAGTMRVTGIAKLDQVARPNGEGSLADATYASTLMTPTGLPIERNRNGFGGGTTIELAKKSASLAEGAMELTVAVPADFPSGHYVPVVRFFFEGIPAESPPARRSIALDGIRHHVQLVYLPVVRIGSPAPPRIPVMLLTDTLSNGSRGAEALEDAGRFGLSSRIRVTQPLVIPRVDGAGQTLTYRLEPHAPTIGLAVTHPPTLPIIPFRFPSGGLTMRIEKPDRSVVAVGPVPFAQPRLKGNGLLGTSIDDPRNDFTTSGFGIIRDSYQLSTMDPRFEVAFDQEGRHVVRLDGTVDDIWGNTWTVGGTYEIHVGRLLSVDTAVVPGTPFEPGDVFSPAVVITPPVPAHVRVRIRLAPSSDPSRMIEQVIEGRANRFGYFHGGDGTVLRAPGEYRVDVTATYTDTSGKHWMGARTWGNVVAPADTPIRAHGRRSMVNSSDLGSPWFFRSQTAHPIENAGSTHLTPPFHSGDVMWAQESDSEFPLITFQSSSDALTALLRTRAQRSGVGVFQPGTFDDRAALGELPLFTSRADFADPHIDPAAVDLWGYSYRFIERPLIAVRELIAEDGVGLPYWLFNDPYAGQIGTGKDGDLPNDFKFQFGGAVLRGSALEQPLYAAYASLFVLVPDNDPRGGTRVFPPFQGNGGGPSGGPLFTLQGKDIDMFLHMTGLRPGSIVETGQVITLAGHVAPTLPARVEIALIAPSGKQLTINGTANSVGYFFDGRSRVLADESGVWKARVRVMFDGVVPSVGPVQAPYPTGNVLGSRDGEFSFYVVERSSPPLQVSTNPFTVQPPAGLTDLELSYTTTMPGFILEEGTTRTLQYGYDAARLRTSFPNLDTDVVTISLLLSGKDANGAKTFLARQIAFHGAELHMPEQTPTPPEPRRRAVRR